MGLSRIGTLQSRNLPVAYVPKNLDEGGKRCLLWFWSARIRSCQAMALCLGRSMGTNVVHWPWSLKNKHWKGNVVGIKKKKKSTHLILVTMKNGLVSSDLIVHYGFVLFCGWSSLQAAHELRCEVGPCKHRPDAHCDSVVCPRWALENNCKQCKTLSILYILML